MSDARPPAKYHLIEHVLADRIRAGVYDVNGIPGERELAAEFSAARVTVRSALRLLEDQGLVTRRERRGTVAISGLDSIQPRRLVRDVVDQFLDRGRKDVRKVLAFGAVSATSAVASALHVEPGAPVLRVVRVRSTGITKLTYTETFLAWRWAAEITRSALERHAYVQLLERLGVKISVAEQTLTSETAAPEIAQALHLPLNSPFIKLTRVIYDETETPIQLFHGWYRADHFEIAMRLSLSADSTKVWIRRRV